MSKREKRRRAKQQQLRESYRVSPQSEGQEDYFESLSDSEIKYIAVTGFPGSGKSLLAAQRAAEGLRSGEFDKIYLSRSVTSMRGEDLGFLKGDLNSKMSPWLAPLTEHLKKFLGNDLKSYLDSGAIEFLPLAQIRGRSLDKAFIIVTEAQNLSFEAFKCILTRLDYRSKVVFDGDFEQNDLQNRGIITDFEKICRALDGELNSFEWIQMDERDVIRSKDIVQILKLLEYANQN